MAYNTVTVINESGNTGTDYAVFVDTVSGKSIQGVKLIDATEGSELPIGISGNPLHVTGSVTATGAATETTLAAINAKLVSGTDIGDVTINNAAGASAVNIQDGGNSITVDGTIAATQSGTWNINNVSGTVSLPTGAATAANQSTIIGHVDGIETAIGTTNTNTGNCATSLAIMDDWDETDRCKVNLIAGQAGITAGAGTVSASTPRVTHASDDPAVVSLQLIDDPVYSEGSSLAKMFVVGGGDQGTVPFSVKPICVEAGSDSPLNTYEVTAAARQYAYGLGNQWRRLRNQTGQLGVTKTVTGAHTAVDLSALNAQQFQMQVKGTGAAATAWTVEFQACIDNINWTTVATHNTATGDGVTIWLIEKPTRYFRFNVTALTLGAATNIAISWVAFST